MAEIDEDEDWAPLGSPCPPLPGEMRIIQIRYQEEPSEEDWEMVANLLVRLRASQPIMDLSALEIWVIPVAKRAAQKEENQLHKLPIIRTLDDEFPMWHYADGSDSEG